MNEVETIPIDLSRRLDIVIEKAWDIFVNQFLNKKYDIELEAPFQLHFASILKLVGESYCLKRGESFFLDLESKVDLFNKNKYIDIICGFAVGENEKCKIPIELKFKTLLQSAENVGAMEIYKDVYNLESLVERDNSFQFAYFLMITDNRRYVNHPKKNSLREEFNTSKGYTIQPHHEYKHIGAKTGKKFYEENGGFVFKKEHCFDWSEPNNEFYFLKMKICGNETPQLTQT
jgi:hypothetical protein